MYGREGDTEGAGCYREKERDRETETERQKETDSQTDRQKSEVNKYLYKTDL